MANEKRLIYLEDAKEALIGWETDATDEEIEWTLDQLPKVDAVEVVRCKDCKNCHKWAKWNGGRYFACMRIPSEVHDVDPYHFCSYGERITDG